MVDDYYGCRPVPDAHVEVLRVDTVLLSQSPTTWFSKMDHTEKPLITQPTSRHYSPTPKTGTSHLLSSPPPERFYGLHDPSTMSEPSPYHSLRSRTLNFQDLDLMEETQVHNFMNRFAPPTVVRRLVTLGGVTSFRGLFALTNDKLDLYVDTPDQRQALMEGGHELSLLMSSLMANHLIQVQSVLRCCRHCRPPMDNVLQGG